VLLSSLLVVARAHAFDARVDASFDAQFYSLRSPFGAPYVYRRRTTSTLGLSLDNLGGAPTRNGAVLTFRSRLRVDSDFGIDGAELDPTSTRYVPGLVQAPLEVMYAYLDGRGYARGLVDFRLGRQYIVDPLGYWSFDGALGRLNFGDIFALSGFAGFEQRQGLPMLASGRFSAEGVWRGNREGLDSNKYPAFLDESALAPAFGAALETARFSKFYSKVSYRKVENRSTVLVSPFFNPGEVPRTFSGSRTSSERVGYGGRWEAPGPAAVTGRAVYDIFNRAVSDADLTLDWYPTAALGIGTDVNYYYPTFDGDSIFNWFTHRGMTTAEARVDFARPGEYELAAASGARWSETEGEPASYGVAMGQAEPSRATQRTLSFLGRASGRYHFGPGTLSLDTSLERGEGRHLMGADLTTRRALQGGRYDTLILASLYDWADELRPERSATSFTYVLGAGVRPGPGLIGRGRLGLQWEHTMNRLVGQRIRLLFTLDFTVLQ
jgi:hypothetical protein